MVKLKSTSDRGSVAIIPAAGSGTRMGSQRPKQFLDLCGRSMLVETLQPFQDCQQVAAIILVVPPEEVDYCKREIVDRFAFHKVWKVVPGGKRRQDSVRKGIEATDGQYDLVVIHDGVRPFVDQDLINRLITAAKGHRAVIAGMPPKETVKEANRVDEVVRTHNRRRIWLVQTPQVFRYPDIREAHLRALDEGWEEATDDAVLVERLGIPVKVVAGSERNIKVTTPYDLELARFLLAETRQKGEKA
jgi:2-C-methyl-D-erythritol 4-phosphate cytidylyltransferase